MSDLSDLLIKLIPVFPLLAVIANGLLGSRYSHEVAHRLAWGSVGLSFLCTIGVFITILRTGAPREVIAYQWIFGGDLNINLAYLVVGVVVVEVVFVYPGIGQLMVDSVKARDIPVVQACALIFAATYILLNLTADIISIITNPRLLHPR